MSVRSAIASVSMLIVCLLLLPGATRGTSAAPPAAASRLAVHFIDVGQGDSIYIALPNRQSLLIDGGDNRHGPAVVQYLRRQGVKKIDYLVATHPLNDHIGGLPEVIRSFPVGSLYMPKLEPALPEYNLLIQAVTAAKIDPVEAKAGINLLKAHDSRGDLSVDILAPNKSTYEDIGDYSVVVRVTFGRTAFLFCGDAGVESELEMCFSSKYKIEADVLKVGSHGGTASSDFRFLSVVSPSIAVISVGAGNGQGCPAPSNLNLLRDYVAKIYRTDQHGTIVITSDGRRIVTRTAKTPIP